MKKPKSTNPLMVELIQDLIARSREEKSLIWRDIAKRLSRSASLRAEVNISRIARYSKKGETLVVPGKVLGSGSINHPVNVAALNFSAKAKEKIIKAGGKCLSLRNLMEQNPKGTGVKIIE
jgi:large subunit ribosomal protein L18e